MKKRSISLLGSTGSIGRQTLEVAAALDLPVRALTAHRSAALLEEQARRLRPEPAAPGGAPPPPRPHGPRPGRHPRPARHG